MDGSSRRSVKLSDFYREGREVEERMEERKWGRSNSRESGESIKGEGRRTDHLRINKERE